MWQILPLKSLCENVLSRLDKLFKGCNIKPTAFEDNTGCIYTDKSKNNYPSAKHIATHVHFFRYHIYDKYTNPHGFIILEIFIPSFTQKIH